MMLFWTLAAVMIAAALSIVAPALLRKQQPATHDRDAQNITIARERLAELDTELSNGQISAEDYASTKLELEQVLLQDLDTGTTNQGKAAGSHGKIGLLSLVILVPLVSMLLYLQLGTPGQIEIETTATLPPIDSTHASASPAGSMGELAMKLRQRLEEKTPDNADGWFLLGRTYMTMKDYPQAVQAFDKTFQLVGEQPAAMLALADALAMTKQGEMSGRPAELVEKSLAMEPENTTALWMAGLIAEERGDYAEALRLWGKLNPLLADSPQEQQQLAIQIARVSAASGMEPPVAVPAAQASKSAETSAASVRLKVSLSSALQQQASANDTVFIYAKAMNGPRFPLAAARYRVSELPLEITLDDSLAVMPGTKLSDFPQVKVGARVSRSGNAIAQSGDLIGEIPDIKVGTGEMIGIVIDSVQQ